jgi:hypothetical protein
MMSDGPDEPAVNVTERGQGNPIAIGKPLRLVGGDSA